MFTIAKERLVKDDTLSERTSLCPTEVITLLTLCLNATYLVYCNEYYQRKFRTAMGSPVSVTIANLVEYDIPFESNDISQGQVQPQRDFFSKDIHSIDLNIKVMAEAFTLCDGFER